MPTNGSKLMRTYAINNDRLKGYLKEREDIVNDSQSLFKKRSKLVAEAIKKNLKALSHSQDIIPFMKAFMPKDEHKKLVSKVAPIMQELQKRGYKMERLKDKTRPIVEMEKIEMDEFEEIEKIELKDGVPTVTIIDKIEEYKKLLREQKNED